MEQKLKQALDESRLLILGAQVLFGFALQAAFQQAFPALPPASRMLHGVALLLLLSALALLIAPSTFHQIACNGDGRRIMLRIASGFGAASLLPLTLGLGLSIYVSVEHALGYSIAVAMAATLTLVGLVLLYGWGLAVRLSAPQTPVVQEEEVTTLPHKIDQMLTEARVLLPGAQAMLGFQLTVTLTDSFAKLPDVAKWAHVAALAAIALCAALLLATAALHRIGYRGADDPQFFRIGSRLVILATIPLALGIAGDVFVVLYKVTERSELAFAVAGAALLLLLALWLAFPILHRNVSRDNG